MIVKIQRPLSSNEDNPPALIYDKDKTVEIFVDFTPELREVLKDKVKVYCEAEMSHGEIVLTRVINDQPW